MSARQPLFLSSGDLIADRRYDYARDLLAGGDYAGAFDLLLQALELAPGFASAWFMLGELREKLGEREAASEAYRQALGADPEDRHGAGLRLARLGVKTAAAMSPGYVRALFDQYAPHFDQALLEQLRYQAPKILFDATFEACAAVGRERRFARAIDLGCGTGLAGEVFWRRVGSLEGVDLSPGMANLARHRGCYASVKVGDMLDYLRGQSDRSADLLIAADAFVYLEDLRPLFAEAARVLEQKGLIAFTVETHAGEGVILGEKLRYAHAERYIRGALAGAGLPPVILRPAWTRTEGDSPVPGLVVVAEQRSRPPSQSEE